METLGDAYRPVHPGELIKDELDARGLQQKQVARELSLSYPAFNEILNGKRPVTTDFALYMEAAFDIPAYLLVNMQADYNLYKAKEDANVKKRLSEIRKIAAIF